MRRTLLIIGAVALAAALGRLSAPAAPSSQTAPLSLSPAPTREVAGIALGYPRSRAGAILAAARYQQAFADSAILAPGVLRRRIQAVATADFAKGMLAANTPGAARLAAGPLGEGIRRQIPTAYFAVPIGYRLLSYSPSRASILIWGFTVVGNAAAVEPSAYFGTARTELAWIDGDWKIAATRAAFGPTPRLQTPRHGGEGYDLIDLTRELDLYEIAP